MGQEIDNFEEEEGDVERNRKGLMFSEVLVNWEVSELSQRLCVVQESTQVW